MQYAIFSNLDVLQHHICSNLDWNGKNESQVVFEGEEEAVKAVVEFCRVGPKTAQVSDVAVTWESCSHEFQSFNIV